MTMRRVYTASVWVDGLKVLQDFDDEDKASMWVRLMAAQYNGRIASPAITCTTYSEIFKAPMTGGGTA